MRSPLGVAKTGKPVALRAGGDVVTAWVGGRVFKFKLASGCRCLGWPSLHCRSLKVEYGRCCGNFTGRESTGPGFPLPTRRAAEVRAGFWNPWVVDAGMSQSLAGWLTCLLALDFDPPHSIDCIHAYIHTSSFQSIYLRPYANPSIVTVPSVQPIFAIAAQRQPAQPKSPSSN